MPYTLKFNYIGEWARQQGLFKLCVTGVAYGFRGLIHCTFCVSIKPCHSHSHIAPSKILILIIWINILYKIALNSLTLKLLCQLECDKVGHFLVTVQKLFKPIFRSHLILKHFSLNHFILRLKVFVKIVFEVGNFCTCSNF